MDWVKWLLLAVTCLSVGGVVYLRMKGYLTTDAATLCIATVVELVRKAEDLWKDYQGAGGQKKDWVLEQLKVLGGKYDGTAAGALIDAVVAWLNATEWK